jgi:iron complex outermembrane receptor protein
MKKQSLKIRLMGGVAISVFASSGALATKFDIPRGDLAMALDDFQEQSGVSIIVAANEVKSVKSGGVKGDLSANAALSKILKGTGFVASPGLSDAVEIVREHKKTSEATESLIRVAAATPRPAPPSQSSIETVIVTAQHKSENIQQVPISVTALSQEQLTERQIAGGPDLLRDVPNMNFGKTNFSGYSIELRGIGTQAISVTTDPAVAVAFNDIPFIRNHFFEQEFFDLQDAEVLRGPQGTLYGRNATAGVVNLESAKPTDQFEAMGSVDIGNYSNRRLEGMINLPLVGDTLDLRIAGEWTKRDGYSFDTTTNSPVDGRDLWSTRASLRWRPNAQIDANLIWEHFSEDDDRLRSGKQLCKTSPIPASIDGVPVPAGGTGGSGQATFAPGDYLSQGCEMSSLYSADAFEVPNGFSLPYYSGFVTDDPYVRGQFDPYAETTQSTNLRDIQAQILPVYRAKNDTVELNVDYQLTPALTLTSQTGYNHDFLWSTEDYNRFDTAPGIFVDSIYGIVDRGIVFPDPNAGKNGVPGDAFVYCDPQLGCSDRLLAQDLNDERAWQISQEFRLASHFVGPLNFSAGGNFLHYETEENYYVFINTVTQFIANNAAADYGTYGTNNSSCLPGYRYPNNNIASSAINGCEYIDPNPIPSVNGEGHNYFLSQNPYLLNSYAFFGEAYYDLTKNLKLTGGLRWTDDQKHFLDIPSELLLMDWGYPVAGVVDQQWQRFTGRTVLDWTPQLDFTDQTLVYVSYAHGYKAGGANPPGALYPSAAGFGALTPIHPLTFKPEYIEAFELGTKNTLLGDSLTLNGDVFYYNYHDYQISRIVDRTAINDNFNAHVVGTELESTWEPLPGLKFNLATGWEDSIVGKGMYSIDLMDRTAGTPGWTVVKPFVTDASNCVLPTYVVAAMLSADSGSFVDQACSFAYSQGLDPVTELPYVQNPKITNLSPIPAGYPGFDPVSPNATNPDSYLGINAGPAPNNGEGFAKNLSGHALPNAPPITVSFGGQYSISVSENWAATLRGDFYYQADSWARIFNDNPYDRLHGYTNLNLALIFASGDGWQVMGYVKNVFNVTAITGNFLNSDDTGLTTNVFLTDPRLYGVRVTKNFGEGDTGAMADAENWIAGLFADKDSGRPPLWIELGGGLDFLSEPQTSFAPSFLSSVTIPAQRKALDVQSPPAYGLDEDAKISWQPEESDWIISASVRFGRANATRHEHQQTKNAIIPYHNIPFYGGYENGSFYPSRHVKLADGQSQQSETHTIMDFTAGKDVGLGMFGLDDPSVISGGVRIAQLASKSSVDLRAEPDVHYTPAAPITTFAQWAAFKYDPALVFHDFAGSEQVSRSFHGVGPTIAWNASSPMLGGDDGGSISFDWGLNAALLFGRQTARGHHQTTAKTYNPPQWGGGNRGDKGYDKIGYFRNRTNFSSHVQDPPVSVRNNAPPNFNRVRNVMVPDLGATIGLSYRYQNAKVSFGYRADEFFGAMDGGIDTHKSENRGFNGPYANISIGLGG